jgi:hypothetical protein
LNHEVEGGVGVVGAFVVVAGFGEAAGGEGEDGLAWLDSWKSCKATGSSSPEKRVE